MAEIYTLYFLTPRSETDGWVGEDSQFAHRTDHDPFEADYRRQFRPATVRAMGSQVTRAAAEHSAPAQPPVGDTSCHW